MRKKDSFIAKNLILILRKQNKTMGIKNKISDYKSERAPFHISFFYVYNKIISIYVI